MNIREYWEKEWLRHPGKLVSSFYSYLYSISINASEAILDVGCGDWKFADPLLKRGKWIVGCDISSNALKRAQKNVKSYENKTDLVQCDARYLPFRDNAFERVVSVEALSLIGDDYEKVFEEMRRVTKRYITFNVSHKEELYTLRERRRENSLKSLKYIVFDEREIEMLLGKLGLIVEVMRVFTKGEMYGDRIPPPYDNLKDAIFVTAKKI